MKIFFISANYPPDHLGGYELRIKEIVDGLASRGHNLQVITTIASKLGLKSRGATRYKIFRRLHNRRNAKFFPKEVLFDLLDLRFIDKQIEKFNPDIVYLGHIYPLSKELLALLAEEDIPLVLDEGGANLKGAWTEHGRWFRFTGEYHSECAILNKAKPFVISAIIKLSLQRLNRSWSWPENLHSIINNRQNFENIQALAIPLKKAVVIHSGIDIEKFDFQPRRKISLPLNLIYPARIESLKAQGEVIKLINELKKAGIQSHVSLIGPIGSCDYYKQVIDQISEYGVKDDVTYMPMVSQRDLVGFYQQSDILFFPTMHKMGFSRVPLEAMACGCIVVSYGNEASDEIIRDKANGYLVNQGDFPGIITIINRLLIDDMLVRQISSSARQEIEQNHSLNQYVDQVDEFLRSIV